jgi:hypothetical protein
MLVLTPPIKVADGGLDVVLACVEEGAILVEGVVLIACVSWRVGVATCAHWNVPLPARVTDMMRFQIYCVMHYYDM